MSRNHERSQIGAPGVSYKINLVLMKSGTKRVGQFNRVCDKLFRGKRAADVFAIGLAGTPAIPLDYHEFFFEFTLKGVGQIHGGHPGTTVQEQQNRKRRIFSTNENALSYI